MLDQCFVQLLEQIVTQYLANFIFIGLSLILNEISIAVSLTSLFFFNFECLLFNEWCDR